MAQSFTCPRGHRWTAAALPETGQRAACPLCGAPAEPEARGFSTLPRPEEATHRQAAPFSTPPLPGDIPTHVDPSPPEARSPGLEVADSAAPTLAASPGPRPAEPTDQPTRAPSLVPRRGAGPRLPSIPGYEVLEILGRGGMGVVYKARQVSLNRLVALKMILAGAHASPTQLARFHIEAEAVASLQHPNIVQVYEIGAHDNCPYFSLELVDGGNLEHLLATAPPAPREAARLVETLARAMHCAHLRGIVHRDLKPANVLLASGVASAPHGFADSRGADATPLALIPKITDFGLAKRLEEESSHTQSGAIMGTPNYMAPEQAFGRTRDVTPAADIYALGAILYELLAGRPPFEGETALQVLDRVRSLEPSPPHRLRPKVPRDLETICLKCLSKQPLKRYPSAEALADDLRRFLSDEPILARPAGWLERTVKWTRRRPALAALFGVSAALLAALVGLGLWSFAEVSARAREAQQERQRAEERSRIARQAVDDMYTQVAEKWLAETPQQDELQREFLDKAVKLYEQFTEEESSDPDLRRETGLAYFRLGQIYRKLERPELAEQAFSRALAVQEQLRSEYPDNRVYQRDVANTSNWRGELLRASGRRLDEAERLFRAARGLQEELVAEVPSDPACRLELARSCYNLGILTMDTGRPTEAEQDYDRAAELLQKLTEEFPQVPDYRHELARTCFNRGILLREGAARSPQAEQDYVRAITLLRELARRYPSRRDYRHELAVSHVNLGNLLLGDPYRHAATEDNYRAALELCTRLVQESPSVPRYQYELANCHNSLAGALIHTQGLAAAEKEWRLALEQFEKLAARPGAGADYRYGLGMTLGNLGWLHLKREEHAEARRALERGIAELELALLPNPENPAYLYALRNQYRDLTETLLRLSEHAEAAKKAAVFSRVLKKNDSETYLAARFLSRCVALAGKDTQLTDTERRETARTYADQAVELLREALRRGFKGAEGFRDQPDFEPLRKHGGFRKLLAEHASIGAGPGPGPRESP